MNKEQIEQSFDDLCTKLEARLGRKPDLNALLYLIGIQESGRFSSRFTKEEKQDLMHVGVCSLLIEEGYYIPEGRDENGWPHFKPTGKKAPEGQEQQELLIKKQILNYFTKNSLG